MSILTVGTVAFDSIETPFGAVDQILGGSATYIALAARYLCERVGLVAVVGQDFPEDYFALLRERDLDLSGIQVDPEGETFAWAGRYHYDLNQRDTLETRLNVLETFEPVVPETFRDSRILCLGNLDPDIQCRVLDQMNGPELVVCDTMNFWIEHTPEALKRLLGRIDCLIVNDAEVRQLSGEPNLVRAARMIREMGPRILVIKKGEHGALLFVEDDVFSAPAFPLEDIEDPTGAGDAFMGGFAGFLDRAPVLNVEALRCAVIYGSTLASFAVERFGPDGLVDRSVSEINRRVEGFRHLSHIPPSELHLDGITH